MKSTPHIQVTEENVIAKTVLMPGDPLRAKYIAEKYLDDVQCINAVRGMLGYTGFYKGKKVSIMGSGMGIPSIGIYTYELFKNYDVDNIIRIGSAGSYRSEVKIFDLVLSTSAYSESTFAEAQNGTKDHVLYPSDEVNEVIRKTAESLNFPIHEGRIHSSDVFYHEKDVTEKMVKDYDCLCVEMESFALFHNAKVLGKNGACILTISDSLVTNEVTTAEQREKSFMQMAELALETAYNLTK